MSASRFADKVRRQEMTLCVAQEQPHYVPIPVLKDTCVTKGVSNYWAPVVVQLEVSMCFNQRAFGTYFYGGSSVFQNRWSYSVSLKSTDWNCLLKNILIFWMAIMIFMGTMNRNFFSKKYDREVITLTLTKNDLTYTAQDWSESNQIFFIDYYWLKYYLKDLLVS